jgi:hypothetical protein
VIKYIIHTETTPRDVNGNTYHFTVVTSTLTRSWVCGATESRSEALRVLTLLGIKWDEVYNVNTRISKRDWQGKVRQYKSLTAKELSRLITEGDL